MACPDCNNENVDCGCIKDALHISQVCNPVDCSTEECTESFAAGCIVYTGDDILCGTTVLVTSGESIAQALANTIAYFCTTDGIENDILCGTDVIVSAPATINEGLEQVAAYFCTQIDNLNIQIGDINNLITIIQADILAVQGDISTINTTIGEIQNALVTDMTVTFGDTVDIEGCTTRTYTINLIAGTVTIATINFSTPPICPPTDVCVAPAGTIQDGVTQVVVCNNGTQELVPSDDFAKPDDIPQICSFILTDVNPATDNLVACRNGTDIINISYQNLVDFILEQANPPTNAYGLFSQTANSIPVTDLNNAQSLFGTGEGSLTIDPNIYTFQVGDAFLLKGAGHLTESNPTSTLKLEVLFNASIELVIDIPLNTITDLHWNLEMEFVIRSTGATGTVMTTLRFTNQEDGGSDVARTHIATQLANVDTTIVNTLDIRATWNAPTAGDEIYSEIMNLHKIY